MGNKELKLFETSVVVLGRGVDFYGGIRNITDNIIYDPYDYKYIEVYQIKTMNLNKEYPNVIDITFEGEYNHKQEKEDLINFKIEVNKMYTMSKEPAKGSMEKLEYISNILDDLVK